METITITTKSAAETIALGQKIGSALRGGEVIALVGNLGTGKTHLIKGIVLGLAPDHPEHVSSPTFVLVNEYLGRGLHVYHIDAYRVESLREFEALGFNEYCRPDSVVLVEWADKVMAAIDPCAPIRIDLAHAGKTKRTLRLSNLPPHLRDALANR